jgi:Domain of unknown function (DUF4129)
VNLVLVPFPAALDPTPDEARTELRRELAKPDYDFGNPLTRLIEWFLRQFDGGIQTASNTPLVTTLAAVLVFALIVMGVGLLTSRARRTARTSDAAGPIGAEVGVSAADYRARALSAFTAEDFNTAVIECFRALARQQVESGWVEDLPQATAREVSGLMATSQPAHAERLRAAAALFDSTLYGDHAASREEAGSLISLDESLGARR